MKEQEASVLTDGDAGLVEVWSHEVDDLLSLRRHGQRRHDQVSHLQASDYINNKLKLWKLG